MLAVAPEPAPFPARVPQAKPRNSIELSSLPLPKCSLIAIGRLLFVENIADMERGGKVARKWAVELHDASNTSSSRDLPPDPLGFSRSTADPEETTSGKQKKENEASWKQQKAWEAAQAPVKNLLMMGFMMWMAGTTVHLFSIGITFSALWQPVSALQSIGKVFEPFQDAKTNTLLPKVAFVALNLAGMGLGFYKLNTLGLLPTHASDWLSNLSPPLSVEYSGGGSSLLL